MKFRTDHSCHALYCLQYHLILVTKDRRQCMNEAVFLAVKDQIAKVLAMSSARLEEIRYAPDHVHVIFCAPPQACIAKLINSIKTTTSRRVRKEMPELIAEYFQDSMFWSRSYMIYTSGEAGEEAVRQYIHSQGRKEVPAKENRNTKKTDESSG